MTINEFDLAELLEDEIIEATVEHERNFGYSIRLQWGYSEVRLDYLGEQTFIIVQSWAEEMFPGKTISVNEILDIVL